jgi:hypothetical protein
MLSLAAAKSGEHGCLSRERAAGGRYSPNAYFGTLQPRSSVAAVRGSDGRAARLLPDWCTVTPKPPSRTESSEQAEQRASPT